MKPEAYRRMKVAGRLFVVIGFSIPVIFILLLMLRLGELAVPVAPEFVILAVVSIVFGAMLWAAGWILEGNTQ
jgi:hypothetical protein